MSTILEIEKIEIYITGDEKQDRPRWAEYLADIFTTNTIVKITTKDGYTGIGTTISYTENQFNVSMGETIKLYGKTVLGQSALNSEYIWKKIAKKPTLISKPAISCINIALWDLRAKHARMPLYQMLGGARDSILSYASSALYKTDPEYIDFINMCMKEGFKAIKNSSLLYIR